MALVSLTPDEARAAMGSGARLIDIRTADEHAREHIADAEHIPMDRIQNIRVDDRAIIFHCKSGLRTTALAAQLEAVVDDAAPYILQGGIDGWRRSGHATIKDHTRPLEIMRQVQIIAGLLILSGVGLGVSVAPIYFGISAFVGAGLFFAGVTGWCGMAKLLVYMPWNRRAFR